MGCFDVYDLITGVSTNGGPDSFLEGEEEREELADGLADKILAAALFPNLPRKPELKQILIDALFCVSDDAGEDKVPFPDSSECTPDVVIGKFGEDEGDETVSIRFCEGYDAYGGFDRMRDGDGQWRDENTPLNNAGFPFMDSRCWYYIHAWASLPRDSDKSLEQRLYETFTDDLDVGTNGISHKLDYGLMGFMWGQFQDSFLENCKIEDALEYLCLDTAPTLSAAISQGLRGKDIAPALFSDFQAWIFETPDLWPRKPEGQLSAPTFRSFETTSEFTQKDIMLPNELLLTVLSFLSLTDAFSFISTSKSMRRLIAQPSSFNLLLRDMVTSLDGSLRWLQPCPLVEGEVNRANEALWTWVTENPKNSVNPFNAPDFPWVEFVYTCLVKSDSMKSRERIWGIIKQVETLLVNGNPKGEDGDSEEAEWVTDKEENSDGSDEESD
ncbi:hypothetical protein DL96DRAFT_1556781 [Flagelloscypha sp. PMI_526]|nr:hypothetical protein DL96DRAFT_1556781 [Flagelloscypha sp. PMI_526]